MSVLLLAMLLTGCSQVETSQVDSTPTSSAESSVEPSPVPEETASLASGDDGRADSPSDESEPKYTESQVLAALTRLPEPEQDSDGWRFITTVANLSGGGLDAPMELYSAVYRLREESFAFEFELYYFGSAFPTFESLGFLSSGGEVFIPLEAMQDNQSNFEEYGFLGFYAVASYDEVVEIVSILAQDDISLAVQEKGEAFNYLFSINPIERNNLRDLLPVYFGLGQGILF